ncbi:MAG: hypothetical protein LBC88_02025 [Spirochaetaceae bacterium]|jgi:membrane protein implicated in regulation of membrane protease activity|nr:hypothetical protein [Spirochaetaceae bacterium]
MAKGLFNGKTHLYQLVFILIILYGVSSVNVLVLALGIIPLIPGMFLSQPMMIGFSLISFALAVFVSAYHLSNMLQQKKRRTDEPVSQDGHHWFNSKTSIARIIFVMLILYGAGSVGVVLAALGILPPYSQDSALNPYVLAVFSIASFVVTVIVSAYHLSTLLRRRKRKDDFQESTRHAAAS